MRAHWLQPPAQETAWSCLALGLSRSEVFNDHEVAGSGGPNVRVCPEGHESRGIPFAPTLQLID